MSYQHHRGKIGKRTENSFFFAIRASFRSRSEYSNSVTFASVVGWNATMMKIVMEMSATIVSTTISNQNEGAHTSNVSHCFRVKDLEEKESF